MLIYNDNNGLIQGTCGDAAGGLEIADHLTHQVSVKEPDGYVLTPARSTGHGTPLEAIAEMVASVADQLGQDTLSMPRYAAYRKAHPEEGLMGAQNVRRRFGTWSAALEAAGLTPIRLNREYLGLNEGDLVVWLAAWLRHYRTAGRGQVVASLAEYGSWVKENPDAPSMQLVVEHGFTTLRRLAARMEQTLEVLPTPKSLSGYGRSKGVA